MAELFVVAGPNGSGKSHFYWSSMEPRLPLGHVFLNSDQIAVERCCDPVEASKVLLNRFDELILEGVDIVVESTLVSRLALEKRIEAGWSRGYNLRLVFLYLPSPDDAIARVRWRVAAGGHDVPEDRIRRRFFNGPRNFFRMRGRADSWAVLDSSGIGQVRPIARRGENGFAEIIDEISWEDFKRLADS